MLQKKRGEYSMLNNNRWVALLTGALYISVQSLFWLNALHLFFRRLEVPLLPEGAIFWLMITAWIVLLPLPYLAASQRHIWFIVAVISGAFVGYLLYDYFGTVAILVVGVTWFSLKKIVEGIGPREFIFLLMSIMILFGIIFIFSYFFKIEAVEVSNLTGFFILSFLITMIGIVTTQLSQHDRHLMNIGFLKQWGIYNAWVWGALAVLSLGSIVVLLALSNVFPLVGWLIKAILTPIVTVVFSIIPWIQRSLAQLKAEAPEDESDLIWGREEHLKLEDISLSPTTTLIWNIVLYTLTAVVIALILYKFYQYVRKQVKRRKEVVDRSQHDPIIVQASNPPEDQHSSWRDKLRGIFKPYTGREEHLLRKEYRLLLKLLRKKGIWKSDTMTVQQLHQHVRISEKASSIYEKLRYGDHELTDDEIRIGRDDIQKIMGEIKK